MKRQCLASVAISFVISMLLIMAPIALANDMPASDSTEKASQKAASKTAKMDCDLTFHLKGWSAIYKTAEGEGAIRCKNGETADVTLKVTGGGLTFGKSEIFDGKGEISGVRSINDIFGSYAAAEAHGGVVKSGAATVLTKGTVSIALAGTGEGVDVGIDFSKFTISKKGAMPKKK
jgi:hypothetical protein